MFYGKTEAFYISMFYSVMEFLQLFLILKRNSVFHSLTCFVLFKVHYFARSHCPCFPDLSEPSLYEKCLIQNHASIFTLYNLIISYTLPSSSRLMHQWEIELGRSLEQKWWELAIDRVNFSSCARLSLIQFKVRRRIHLTNVKLSKLFPGVDVLCHMCYLAPADHTQIFLFVQSCKIFGIPF